MNDLDTLRPEVRRAIESLDVRADEDWSEYFVIRAELLRLTRDNDALRSKCNVIMSGSTRHLGRAERAEAELAALKARIAQAPLEVVESLPGAVGPPWPRDHWIEVRMADPCACVGQGLIGKRVRLVVEE